MYWVRGERYSGSLAGRMIENDVVHGLLHRLAVPREGLVPNLRRDRLAPRCTR